MSVYISVELQTNVGRSTISALKMNRPQLTRVRKMWVKMGEHPPNI